MAAALMHHALERAAARFGDRHAVLAGDERWTFRDLDDRSTSFARYLAGRGVRSGDRVAVMTSNRPEFVVAINGISKAGAAAVLLSPAWRVVEVGHALALTGPVQAVADGPAVDLLVELMGEGPVTDLDHREPDRVTAGDGLIAAADRRPGRGGAGVQLGHHRPPQSGPAHPPFDGLRHGPLVHGPRPGPRRPVPGGHAALAYPRAAQPAGRGVGRCRGAPPPSVRPRRGAGPDPVGADDNRDGRGPHRIGHGQPPGSRALRPVVAPLHHVGGHPGERARGPGGHRADRGALAARLRGQ